VATEVRNLAQRSAAAAKEIKELINESATRIADGSALASNAGETMAEIVQRVGQVSAIIGAISEASTHQEQGIEQVNAAICEMDGVTQQNAALVEQAAAATASLAVEAGNLTQAVSLFKFGTARTSRAALAVRKPQPNKRIAA
ncbi:MAG: methyl-accepting chemotaxis protein, partial [Rhodospirillaceae bacterium]|nr:methyl-accepting chemotaxis protein [Rhodospirillaceae bacterium]